MRPKYLITWHGTVGEVWRDGQGGYQPVMFLHCNEAEAREIADDLAARFVNAREPKDRLPSVDAYRQNPDHCPNSCEHARRYGLPDEIINDVTAALEGWKRRD